jgi:hypothetical protein
MVPIVKYEDYKLFRQEWHERGFIPQEDKVLKYVMSPNSRVVIDVDVFSVQINVLSLNLSEIENLEALLTQAKNDLLSQKGTG